MLLNTILLRRHNKIQEVENKIAIISNLVKKTTTETLPKKSKNLKIKNQMLATL